MTIGEAFGTVRSRWAGALAGPLGRQLLGALLLLSLFPLVLSNGFGYLRSAAIIEGLVERYLDGIAAFQALHVSDQVERHRLFLEAMASDEAIHAAVVSAVVGLGGSEPLHGEATNPFLDRQLVDHPAFEALYVFTADGEILASSPLAPTDLGFWIGPPLREPKALAEIVRDPKPPHAPRLRLAVPVRGSNGVLPNIFMGGWVQVLGPSEFLRIPPHTAGSVESFIVDEEGSPIFVSHPHRIIDFGTHLTSPLLADPPPTRAVYTDPQGVEVIGTIVSVPDRPWRLITEVPVSDALLELRQLRHTSQWLSAFLGVLVVALALAMAGRIVAPVRRLVAATRRLASGDLSARVEVRARNEIGELGTAFNDMASELARASIRVQELHHREIERASQLATVGELAAGIAHEIKNPIVGISGGLDLVMRNTHDHAKLRPIIDEMGRQIWRVDLAVKDLLAFARPATPDFTPVDINEVVERALMLVRPTAATADVRIDVEASPVPRIHADEEMIRQTLVNLIMNGVQATKSGGRVKVATRARGDGVEIRISDTGSGIPPHLRDQIFKPFFTTKHQGTGLGLPITRSVIERHRGTLSLESEEGKGTTFTVVLPRGGADEESGDGSLPSSSRSETA